MIRVVDLRNCFGGELTGAGPEGPDAGIVFISHVV